MWYCLLTVSVLVTVTSNPTKVRVLSSQKVSNDSDKGLADSNQTQKWSTANFQDKLALTALINGTFQLLQRNHLQIWWNCQEFVHFSAPDILHAVRRLYKVSRCFELLWPASKHCFQLSNCHKRASVVTFRIVCSCKLVLHFRLGLLTLGTPGGAAKANIF